MARKTPQQTTAAKTAVAAYKAAKRSLAQHTDPDSPAYLADHDRVVETEKHVPWYRR
ncbi:hypothetical protein [Streptomyces iranensis]|uniref:Uncharacterized protein n=1 Tax=Streptomyces iranensis TaxID=576784 RepID=A0A060ZMB2_9ACTN|nr:hypothetical protein [Streptomyces iranensis]MBP2062463.1 hypothetical protein [Streptomyces iranensis]CDR07327.1 predicted protein [Streptomyces iranensis]